MMDALLCGLTTSTQKDAPMLVAAYIAMRILTALHYDSIRAFVIRLAAPDGAIDSYD